jgi:hypothetical protein
MVEAGIMGFRKNPCLKWKSGGKRGDGKEGLVFNDDAALLLNFLSDDITEDAPVLIIEILFGPIDFFSHSPRDNRKSDELRVGMLQRSPGCDTVIFEDEDISESLVIPQINDPVTVGRQNVFDTL